MKKTEVKKARRMIECYRSATILDCSAAIRMLLGFFGASTMSSAGAALPLEDTNVKS